MRFKKVLASFLSIAMIAAMIPTISFAELTDAAKGQKAKVEMVLLTQTEDGDFVEATSADIAKTAGSTFYVGLKTSNFNNIYEVANFAEKTSGSGSMATDWGLNTICLGVSFNSNYLIVEPDTMYWDDDVEDEEYGGGLVPGNEFNPDYHTHDSGAFKDLLTERADIIPLNSDGDAATTKKINDRFGVRTTKRQYALYNGEVLSFVTDLPQADTKKGYTDRFLITADSPSSDFSFPWSGADSMYLAIIQFGFKQNASDLPDGTSLIGFSAYDAVSSQAYNNFTFGGGADSNLTPNVVDYQDNNSGESGDYTISPQDVRTVIDFVDAPLFPAGVARRDGIKVTKVNNLLNLSAIPNGRNLVANAAENNDFTVTGHMTDDTTTALQNSTVKFYWANTGTADADGVSTTEVPEDMSAYNEITMTDGYNSTTNKWNGGVQKDTMDGKYLYVVADGYIACLGQMTVQNASITGLSKAALTPGGTTKIVGVDTISFTGGSVTAAYSNGKSRSIQYSDFEDNGLAVYKTNGANPTSFTELEGTEKWDSGNNNDKKNWFAIALKTNTSIYANKTGDTPAKDLMWTATGVTTSYSIQTQPKTAYTYPQTLDIKDLVIKVTSNDSSLAGNKALSDAYGSTKIFDTVKIGNETITMNNDGTSSRKITKADATKTIDFYKGNTKVVSSSAITFTPKNVTLTVTESTLSKVYDGGTATTGTGVTATGAITYGVTGKETDDSAISHGTISGVTAAYTSADVSADPITIEISGSPASDNEAFNNRYKIVIAETGLTTTGTITPKPLVGSKLIFTHTEGQDASYDATQDFVIGETVEGTTDKAKEFELNGEMGKVGSDDVKIVMTNGKISGSDKKNGTQSTGTDIPVNVTDATFTLGGSKAGNYSFTASDVVVKVSVTNLPVVDDLSQAAKDKITAAQTNGTNNWKAADQKTLAQFIALLPTTDTVTDNKGNSRELKIEWAIDPEGTTLDPQGGTYTFKGTVKKDPSVTDEILITVAPTVQITVDASEVTAVPDLSGVKASYTVGDPAENFPTTADITVDGQTVAVGLTWKDAAGNTVTAPVVSADNGQGDVYTVEIDYTNVPNWVTTTNAPASTTKTIIVSAVPQTEITFDGTIAPVTIKANDAANIAASSEAADQTAKLAEKLVEATKLPTTIEFKDAAGKTYNVPVTWATADAYDAKKGEYTYTATLDNDFIAGENLKLPDDFAAITTKVTVDPVHIKLAGTTFGTIQINQGVDPTTGITFVAGGKSTEDGDTATNCYAITWSPSASALDTSVVGNSQDFTGTITIDSAYPWLSLPLNADGTDMTSGVLSVTVKKKSSGGGGGGTSSYTVKFSAGKFGKIVEGKTSISVVSGKKVETVSLPKVEANEGYKFLGWSIDGKTVIDPTVDEVKKGVSYTALYEEIVEPTPTPTPTPLLKNTLKPYASGYDDNMFLPNDYITRAELASMIARLIAGDDVPASYKASFPDVDNTWYNKYIGYLEDKDVLSGYEDGTFRPNQTVTRGEMCAIIVRAQRYGLIPVDGLFSDVTDEDWAKSYITTLAVKNIVSGYENGTFGTYSPITRAETVVIINRVLDPSTPVIEFTPIDIAGHWAYADIILAVNERTPINDVATLEVTPEATPEVTPEVTPEETVEPEETPAA